MSAMIAILFWGLAVCVIFPMQEKKNIWGEINNQEFYRKAWHGWHGIAANQHMKGVRKI